jgi:hypothetical protein
MRTGEPVPESGHYRSACGCRVSVLYRRSARARRCPICERAVDWTFEGAASQRPRRRNGGPRPPAREIGPSDRGPGR